MRHTQRRYTISRLQEKEEEEEEKQQAHHNSSSPPPPPVCSRQIFGVVDKKDIRKALKSLGIFSSSLLLLQTWDPRKRGIIKKGKTTQTIRV